MDVRDISLFCRGGSPKSKAVSIEIFCVDKPLSARMAVKAVQKCCHVRGLLCSVRNRVPGCGPSRLDMLREHLQDKQHYQFS